MNIPDKQRRQILFGDNQNMPPKPKLGVSKEIAQKILKIRDAFTHSNYEEAYHVLYSIASPEFDKYKPWEELEKIAAENLGERYIDIADCLTHIAWQNERIANLETSLQNVAILANTVKVESFPLLLDKIISVARKNLNPSSKPIESESNCIGLEKLLDSLIHQSNGCDRGSERYILSGIIDYTKELIEEEKQKQSASLKIKP